jgi:hypothetical protein
MGSEREPLAALHGAPAPRHRPTPVRREDPSGLLGLQARAGNAAVAALLRAGAVARRPPAGEPVRPRPSGPPTLQRFDPRYHREAAVEGLIGSFSPDEIGAIYGANWERDFSQAHPAFGDVVLRWKQVKVAAFEGHLVQADVDAFRTSVATLIDLATNPFTLLSLATDMPSLFTEESYGGYHYWEHLDNPGQEPALAKNPALRGELLSVPAGSAIPRYMMDAREYIKAQLFDAANAYRGGDLAAGATAAVRAAWTVRETSLRARMGGGAVAAGGLRAGATAAGSDAASREAALQAGLPVGAPPGVRDARFTAAVADGLGRASHTLEDFFAHSNFVELAIGEPNVETLQADPTGATKTVTGQLGTGTFGTADKKHALAHKLRAIADEIESEMPLVDRVTGRSTAAPARSQVHVGSEAEPREASGADTGSWREALGWTGAKAAWRVLAGLTVGGLAGSAAGTTGWGFVPGPIRVAVGAWAGARVGLRSAVNDVIATADGVRMLRRVAERLEDESRAEAQPGSHTRLAKDQPGHHAGEPAEILKTVKFRCAVELAKEADRRIIGQMRAVFDAPSPADADARLAAVYRDLDAMIGPPAGHPLGDTLDAFRTELLDALHEAYPETTAGMGT